MHSVVKDPLVRRINNTENAVGKIGGDHCHEENEKTGLDVAAWNKGPGNDWPRLSGSKFLCSHRMFLKDDKPSINGVRTGESGDARDRIARELIVMSNHDIVAP